jgi:hypothetical protein
MKTPLIETIIGWLTAGFTVLWVLELRRTDFQQSYWLLMVALACLFTFQLMRTRRLAPKSPEQKSTPPPQSKSKKGNKKK